MKRLMIVMLAGSAAGCATSSALPMNELGRPGAESGVATPFDPAPTAAISQPPDTTPRIVLPATGGAPFVGIPVGVDLYLPVTGGPPVVGLSTGP
jgi:hypothetical protein